jgi:putative alpha-1,2-mannosidase
MIGFYPANPASGEYVFSSPVFDEVTLKMPSGKKMIIRTKNNAKNHPYIQSITLNGKPYAKTFINHTTLLRGGELIFVMGDKPNKDFGAKRDEWPG